MDRRIEEAYTEILAQRPKSGRPDCASPEQLVELAEGKLGPRERLELLDHVAGCGACHEEFKLLRALFNSREGS